MTKMIVNGKEYTYIKNYKNDSSLRKSFNELTRETWGFDFEAWYESGFWDDKCILYSLLDGTEMVSHITVNVIHFTVLGEKKRYVQLGTVMTAVAYRKQGLNKILMDIVLGEWKHNCDMVYLYANDTVLDFYPKFGFVPVSEYKAVKAISSVENPCSIRKMDLATIADQELLEVLGQSAAAQFAISTTQNLGLIMFYCRFFEVFSFRDNLYYAADLNAIVVAEYQEDTLVIYDILAPEVVVIDAVIAALATIETVKVVLQVMPCNTNGYTIEPHKEEDLTLFVMDNHKELFEKNQLIFPMLSHT